MNIFKYLWILYFIDLHIFYVVDSFLYGSFWRKAAVILLYRWFSNNKSNVDIHKGLLKILLTNALTNFEMAYLITELFAVQQVPLQEIQKAKVSQILGVEHEPSWEFRFPSILLPENHGLQHYLWMSFSNNSIFCGFSCLRNAILTNILSCSRNIINIFDQTSV